MRHGARVKKLGPIVDGENDILKRDNYNVVFTTELKKLRLIDEENNFCIDVIFNMTFDLVVMGL